MLGERKGSVGHTRWEGFLRGWELTKELHGECICGSKVLNQVLGERKGSVGYTREKVFSGGFD